MSKELKLSDQVIGQIRELLQFCLVTQTNFVDHMRAVRLEQQDDKIVLTRAYIEGWNDMVTGLLKQQQAASEKLADETDDQVVEEEVVISQDPKTGKLIGKREKVN
jgi:hypothetical protein